MLKRFIICTVAVVSVMSCAKDVAETDFCNDGSEFEISAPMGQTRTFNDGIYTCWSADDSVHMFHKLTGASSYVDDGVFRIKDASAGTFVGRLASSLDPAASYDWKMVYPYTPDGTVTPGQEWVCQESNGSTAHLCGAVCPLEGTLASNPASQMPIIQMHNLAGVAKIIVTNAQDYPLVINTVKVGQYNLEVASPGEIAPGDSASFYVPVGQLSGGSYDVTVANLKRSFSATGDSAFPKGAITPVRFKYETPDASISEVMVWDSDRYSSFSDIIHFGHKFYCAFREAGGHVAENFDMRGKLVVRSSDDAVTWEDELEVVTDYDMRDPHFIISDDGSKLFMYYGRALPTGESGYFPEPYCSAMVEMELGSDGRLRFIADHDVDMGAYSQYWLWGLTKHNGYIYGVGYHILPNYPILFKSQDGVHFDFESFIYIKGNEAHPCFVGDKLYVFFRSVETQEGFVTYATQRNGKYTRWQTNPPITYKDMLLHCPVSLLLWDKIFVCVRGKYQGIPIYMFNPATGDLSLVHDVYANPNTDRAYPGMIVYNDCLYVSYYAYKTKAQNIYCQRIPLSVLHRLSGTAQ